MLFSWREHKAKSYFSSEWMRSSAVSWKEAVMGSGKMSNKSKLVVGAGTGSGFCWSHLSRQSLNVLPVIIPRMKCLPRREICPLLHSIHLPSRIYSLRTSQLFLKWPLPQKWQRRSWRGEGLLWLPWLPILETACFMTSNRDVKSSIFIAGSTFTTAADVWVACYWSSYTKAYDAVPWSMKRMAS